MPRGRRVLYDGAIYHIFNRGNNKQVVFRDGCDYKVFKELIKEFKKRYKFELFNYCFMVNHFHLLMKMIEGKYLPKIMQCILQVYARYHKRRYENVGYLYQGRYKGLIIEKEEYLSECARYIERNPLRADV